VLPVRRWPRGREIGDWFLAGPGPLGKAEQLAAGTLAAAFGSVWFPRLRIRADVVDICQRERKTVLFVTHDVEEAVQLADRVVVLGPRPARLREIVPVATPRLSRNLDDPVCHALRDEIFHVMGFDRLGKEVKSASEAESAHLRIVASVLH
jgi:hypothetical protein